MGRYKTVLEILFDGTKIAIAGYTALINPVILLEISAKILSLEKFRMHPMISSCNFLLKVIV
jgi:hypothetical protein